MKNYLLKIVTLIVCFIAIGTTCCFADVARPDFPANTTGKRIITNSINEVDIGDPVYNWTSNTTPTNSTTNKSNKKEKNESSTEIDIPKLMIIIGGTIAVISAMSIVILAFISKK